MNLELDPKYGQHDYTVYLNFRNQTKSSFLSLSQRVYNTSFERLNKKGEKFLELKVIDRDMVHEMGYRFNVFPSVSWRSGVMSGQIKSLSIVDLCVFDSDMGLIMSQW